MRDFIYLPCESFFHLVNVIGPCKFTKREIDIIACVANSHIRSKEIADILKISTKTIDNYVIDILGKMGGEYRYRYQIAEYVEQYDKQGLIKNDYFLVLQEQLNFEKLLSRAFGLNKTKALEVDLHWEGHDLELKERVIADFLKAGINVKADTPDHIQDSHQALVQISLIAKTNEGGSKKPFYEFKISTTSEKDQFKKETELQLIDMSNYYIVLSQLILLIAPDTSLEKILEEFSLNIGKIHSSHIQPLKNSNPPTFHNFITKPWLARSGCVLVLGCLVFFFFLLMQPNDRLHSDMPLPNESVFLKRPQVMASIEKKFETSKDIKAVALIGIGGAGKTTLAREFAREQQNSIIWEINAETVDTLTQSFFELAHAMSKSSTDKEELLTIEMLINPIDRRKKIIKFVQERLKRRSGWFLVYDNVEDFSDIAPFFPKDRWNWGKGNVILTTRNINIADNQYLGKEVAFLVGQLSKDEQRELFFKIIDGDNNSYEKLLEEIPLFPLDTMTAAYYIKNTKTTEEEYIERLKHYGEEFANMQSKVLKEVSDYTKNRYGIIIMSLKNLIETGPDTKELMLLVCLLDCQNIPKELLESFKNSLAVDHFMHNLKKSSLILSSTYTLDKTINVFSIHRSTQAICLAYLSDLMQIDKNKSILAPLSEALEKYFNDSISKYNFASMSLLINHTKIFLKHKNLLKTQTRILLQEKLGTCYAFMGNYVLAAKVLEAVIDEYKKLYALNDLKILKTMHQLGYFYECMGDYEKAKKNLEVSNNLLQTHHAGEHGEIAMNLLDLGNVYRSLGDYVKAKALIEEAINLYKTHGDLDEIRFNWAQVYLSTVYRDLGEFEAALKLVERAYQVYEKKFGDGHLFTAWILVHMGNTYAELKNYSEASNKLKKAYEIYQKYYGLEHSRTAWALMYYARALSHLGHSKKAKDMMTRSLSIYMRYYDEGHLRVAKLQNHLGDIEMALGNPGKARKIYSKSYQVHKKHYGENHPKSLQVAQRMKTNVHAHENKMSILKLFTNLITFSDYFKALLFERIVARFEFIER